MKGTVLVVDDSAMMRKVVLRILKMADLEFEAALEAGDGNEALALLRTNTVALIMCDINMPVMSGLQLLQQIKEEKLAVGVPIQCWNLQRCQPRSQASVPAEGRPRDRGREPTATR